jgi:hypothetical protein
VLPLACASPEAPATPEAPSSAAAPAEPAKAEPAKAEPAKAEPGDGTAWHWRGEAGPSAKPTYLLGLMGQSGIEHCPGGGFERTWLSVRPMVGRVSVSGPADAVLEPLMDRAVLALGQPGDPPPRTASPEPAPKVEPCLPAQMRSDWQSTPRGLLIERDGAPSLPHLRLEAIRPLHELAARQDGDHLVITLQNPVPVALTGVELRAHYEGCFGKPGSTVETTAIGELGVGAQASARVPMLLERSGAPPSRAEFRAYSIQLRGQGDGVVIDLDVPFDSLGVPVKCPRD